MSARELAEWQALYQLESQYRELVNEKVDPEVAYEMVYGRTE